MICVSGYGRCPNKRLKLNTLGQSDLFQSFSTRFSLFCYLFIYLFSRINFAYACKCLLLKPLCIWFGHLAMLMLCDKCVCVFVGIVKCWGWEWRKIFEKSVLADVSNLLHTIRLYVTNPSQTKLRLSLALSREIGVYIFAIISYKTIHKKTNFGQIKEQTWPTI